MVNTNVGKSYLQYYVIGLLPVFVAQKTIMISVQVNQKKHQVLENTSLEDLIGKLNIRTNGIAVAINNRVIKKTDWKIKQLQHSDTILIITSTQGG